MITRGRVRPASPQICRVASIPSIRGIRTSIRTTSAGCAQQLHGLRAVGGLADDLHVGLGVEHHAEPGAHQFLVVDEDAPGCSRRRAPGGAVAAA